jgi:hypothetical protein
MNLQAPQGPMSAAPSHGMFAGSVAVCRVPITQPDTANTAVLSYLQLCASDNVLCRLLLPFVHSQSVWYHCYTVHAQCLC